MLQGWFYACHGDDLVIALSYLRAVAQDFTIDRWILVVQFVIVLWLPPGFAGEERTINQSGGGIESSKQAINIDYGRIELYSSVCCGGAFGSGPYSSTDATVLIAIWAWSNLRYWSWRCTFHIIFHPWKWDSMDFYGEMLAAPCFQVPPISLVSGLNFYLDLRAPLTDSGTDSCHFLCLGFLISPWIL